LIFDIYFSASFAYVPCLKPQSCENRPPTKGVFHLRKTASASQAANVSSPPNLKAQPPLICLRSFLRNSVPPA
jgi:hypothetical protein